MNKFLRKDLFIEIKQSFGRFLSIFLIVTLGVAFFSGIEASSPDMKYTGDAYFDEQRLMDLEVVSTLGVTEEDADAIAELSDIARAEPAYSTDVLRNDEEDQSVLHVESLLDDMNLLLVEDGVLPQKAGECLLDSEYMEDSGLEIGDTIHVEEKGDPLLTETEFLIVGSGSSPFYISFSRGNSTLGTGEVDGFFYVTDDSFSSDFYTKIYAEVKGAAEELCYSSAYESLIDDAEEQIEGIANLRCEARYDSVWQEAQDALTDAREELENGRQESEETLEQSRAQLEEAEQELEAGQQEYEDGLAQYEAAQGDLEQRRAQVREQEASYEAENSRLEEMLAQIEADQAVVDAAAPGDAAAQALQEDIAGRWSSVFALQDELAALSSDIADNNLMISGTEEALAESEQTLQQTEQDLADGRAELQEGWQEYEDGRAEAEASIADAEAQLAEAEEAADEITDPEWILSTRDSLPDYTDFGDNAQRLRNIGEVFPVLFFLVAALISLTTMTRMVEEQRTQIGTLKGLGYSRWSIISKYLFYAAIATVAGCIVGVLSGEKVLPYVIIYSYKIMYDHMPTMVLPYEATYSTIASLAALASTLLAALASCYRELREVPASLMRPAAPKAGKRVFLDRIPIIWNRLNFTWKATVRNLLRYRRRLYMTVFGIAGCMGLLLVGFGLHDSIIVVGTKQYTELQTYHGILVVDGDASSEEKEDLKAALGDTEGLSAYTSLYMQKMEARNGKRREDVYLYVPEDLDAFSSFVIIRDRITHESWTLDDEGVVITEKAARVLDVDVGDTITLQEGDKKRREVPVAYICENYLEHYVYMSPTLYEETFGKPAVYNDYLFQVNDDRQDVVEDIGREILEQDAAVSISYTASTLQEVVDMLDALGLVTVVLIVSAALLAFVVLYNLNTINITERKRELATLKVLGFYDMEMSSYVLRENIILTILGIIGGVILGTIMHRFIIVTVEVDACMFGRSINLSSYLWCALLTFAFSGIVNVMMYFRLKKIDMVESLKSVE